MYFRVKLTPRCNEFKVLVKGIFTGALVQRGHDWKWGNQDGGEGNEHFEKQIYIFLIFFLLFKGQLVMSQIFVVGETNQVDQLLV